MPLKSVIILPVKDGHSLLAKLPPKNGEFPLDSVIKLFWPIMQYIEFELRQETKCSALVACRNPSPSFEMQKNILNKMA